MASLWWWIYYNVLGGFGGVGDLGGLGGVDGGYLIVNLAKKPEVMISINKLIFKRGIAVSRISSLLLLVIREEEEKSNFLETPSANKKKVLDALKMTDDRPTERLSVNLYKYAEMIRRKRKFSEMIKLEISQDHTPMHEFNYQEFDCMTNMDKWWKGPG
ncbi:hypothetical protein HAX54_038155, partial [Datura stramonium]|nr:hypothetical protein [Datura stramonium]